MDAQIYPALHAFRGSSSTASADVLNAECGWSEVRTSQKQHHFMLSMIFYAMFIMLRLRLVHSQGASAASAVQAQPFKAAAPLVPLSSPKVLRRPGVTEKLESS